MLTQGLGCSNANQMGSITNGDAIACQDSCQHNIISPNGRRNHDAINFLDFRCTGYIIIGTVQSGIVSPCDVVESQGYQLMAGLDVGCCFSLCPFGCGCPGFARKISARKYAADGKDESLLRSGEQIELGSRL